MQCDEEEFVTPHHEAVLEEVGSPDQKVTTGGRNLGGVRQAEETCDSSCVDPSVQQPQDHRDGPEHLEREDEEFYSWGAWYLGIAFEPRHCQ